jgi:4-amino-4-deoxy-L-arabinose transferase-like glycosyltransferase
MPQSKRLKYLLLLVLLISAFLRCGVAVYVQRQLDQQPGRTYVIEGDADGYWKLAQCLIRGKDYSIYHPPRRVLRMPGFPLFLAGAMSVIGEDHFRVRLVLALSGVFACFVVYLLGKELVNETIGIIAAALVAVSPVMAGFSVLFLSETLFAVAMLISLWVLVKLLKTRFGTEDQFRGSLLAFLTGISLAAAFYVRPSWLLILPVIVVILVISAKGYRTAAMQRALVMTLGFALMLVPWVYRNYRVTGHFVPTTLWAGPSLYDGLNPKATGDSDMTFFDQENVLNEMSEYEMNQHYTRRAVAYAEQHPGHVMQLMGAKLLRYWKPWPNAPQFQSFWMMLAVSVIFVPVMLFALYGAWVSRNQYLLLLITLGPLIYFSMIHLIFVSSLRYRLPAEYSLYILSAVGIYHLFLNLKQRKEITPGQ